MFTNRSCGIILALKRRTIPPSAVQRVFAPDSDLAGRVGGLRIRMRSGPDLSIFNLYFPTSRFPRSAEISLRMWQWLEEYLVQLPCRTIPVVLTDANARLGTTRLNSPVGAPLVGTYTNQRENAPGRLLRTILLRNNLAAVNTLSLSRVATHGIALKAFHHA